MATTHQARMTANKLVEGFVDVFSAVKLAKPIRLKHSKPLHIRSLTCVHNYVVCSVKVFPWLEPQLKKIHRCKSYILRTALRLSSSCLSKNASVSQSGITKATYYCCHACTIQRPSTSWAIDSEPIRARGIVVKYLVYLNVKILIYLHL